MISDLGLAKELTLRRVYLIFSQSRMLTVDEASKRSQLGMLTQLSFEGFLEAIIRVAMVKVGMEAHAHLCVWECACLRPCGSHLCACNPQAGTRSEPSLKQCLALLACRTQALPTDREMRRYGFEYPGEFIGALLDQGSGAYNQWLHQAQLKQRRGGADPIWRRLDMFILLVVSIMQVCTPCPSRSPSEHLFNRTVVP